ncbi:hypothetical protein CJJ13_19900 [Serratia fonticola]|nr:hypothetical protein CJJ13_19900 [Serratia fonticola]
MIILFFLFQVWIYPVPEEKTLNNWVLNYTLLIIMGRISIDYLERSYPSLIKKNFIGLFLKDLDLIYQLR